MKKTIASLFLFFSIPLYLAGQEQSIKISGYMFGDYFYNVSRDTSLASQSNVVNGGAKDLNGFQFRRIYLTFDNKISTTYSVRLRLEGTTGAPVIKDASLRWKNIFSGSDLFFGIQPTPAFEISETYWGFRSLEKTILDLRGFVASRDFGLSLKGNILSDGSMKYWVLYGNNSYIGAETDKYKRLYAHIDFIPMDKFRLTLYADYKLQSGMNDPNSTAIPPATLGRNVLSTALFLGYAEKEKYSFGAEGIYQVAENGYAHGAAPVIVDDKTAAGLSLFGTFVLNEEISILGRYDYFDPNIDSGAKYDTRNFFITGINWTADKNVSIIPNIIIETYENTQTGTGSRALDPSITGRITLYYVFL
jgi:hypothetical protein